MNLLSPPMDQRPRRPLSGGLCLAFLFAQQTVTLCHAGGAVVAWGDNSALQSQVPAGLTDSIAVSAGFLHSVALKSDGTVVSWGYNFFGQTNTPPGLTNVTAISAGYSLSLALQSDGSLAGWG